MKGGRTTTNRATSHTGGGLRLHLRVRSLHGPVEKRRRTDYPVNTSREVSARDRGVADRPVTRALVLVPRVKALNALGDVESSQSSCDTTRITVSYRDDAMSNRVLFTRT